MIFTITANPINGKEFEEDLNQFNEDLKQLTEIAKTTIRNFNKENWNTGPEFRDFILSDPADHFFTSLTDTSKLLYEKCKAYNEIVTKEEIERACITANNE